MKSTKENLFLVRIVGGTVIVLDEVPSKDDWSVNLFATEETRSLCAPKTKKQWLRSKEDYRWKYSRKVVACSFSDYLPAILEYVDEHGGSYRIIDKGTALSPGANLVDLVWIPKRK